ncbi:MAG: ribosome biogenesis GTPase YlqF [Clostridia bacterium]
MIENIVWFPGHMAKAKRKIKETLPLVDMVIELLDARLPISSQNPDFLTLFNSKATLTLLTKSSLADKNETTYWINKLRADGRNVIAIDCKTNSNMQKVTEEIKLILAEKIARSEQRGMKNRALRCLVVGITNVGKSTFINTYTKTKKAKVEDRPGVTRENQWVSAQNGVELLDTPGLLWHKFDDESIGIKLAAIGSIRDDILDALSLSHSVLDILTKKYPHNLEERYKIKILPEDTSLTLFDKIAKSRGFLKSGGIIDEDRCAACILDELRGGKIGTITLD